MWISISNAEGQLSELVRHAEACGEVVLTERGYAVARLVPVKRSLDRAARRSLLEAARKSGAAKATPAPSAARSQDFCSRASLKDASRGAVSAWPQSAQIPYRCVSCGCAAVTRHTVLPLSSAMSSAPLLSRATPTGRPRA
ncbi:hypothetical protein F8237_29165 [Bradyrhizobium betae]|uniref:Antitoxin n=1 Tax=Bradyrhizobium betae TaxID=244734 RepID=A0A5P6PCM8_9BRAD|nr:hypothetical protein F8237_29165 [Bradyrhizobium betae]